MILKTKIEIEEWLNKYKVKNYTLIPDDKYGYVVNVNESVNLSNMKLKLIKVKFNIVNGNFYCSHNKLESLDGCPEIVMGYFDCSENKLKSLKDCPNIVAGWFDCDNNQLDLNGIKNLINVEINNNKLNFFNNPELGNLQKITDLNEIKKILTIYQEKTDIIKVLEVTDKSIENLDVLINSKNYNLIEKINKI